MQQIEALEHVVGFLREYQELPQANMHITSTEQGWHAQFTLPDTEDMARMRDVVQWACTLGAELQHGTPMHDGKRAVQEFSADRMVCAGLRIGVRMCMAYPYFAESSRQQLVHEELLAA